MKRNIVRIDEEKCTGCGLCATACHEGAIAIIDGVARLVSDSYCDGLGACLPACPVGAITIEEREAEAFDEAAVKKHLDSMGKTTSAPGGTHTAAASPDMNAPLPCGCPGTHAHAIERHAVSAEHASAHRRAAGATEEAQCACGGHQSELRQWPCQIQLVPVNAPYFDGAELLIAADCTAYSYANFHRDFMRGKITLVGCPKLDDADYAAKLAQILRAHEIKSLTVVRIEVPCCGGLVAAVKKAMADAGAMVPWRVITLSTEGEILDEA